MPNSPSLRKNLLLIALTAPAMLGQSDPPAYTWSKTGPLQIPRAGACAASLADGRILVAGGEDFNGPLRSVELYQPDGSFAPAHDMLRTRVGHTCTSLADGRILVAGGLGDGPSAQAEVYDPASDNWTAAELGTQRWNQTATLLPDGRVLLAGGETADGPANLLEWFNPVSNRIRPLPANLSAARTLHASALLPDGSVLVAGGWNGQNLLDAAEIVKLDGTVQSASTALPSPRAGHTATALANGCVLIAGGVGTDGDLKSSVLYCADSGTFQPSGDLAVSRYLHLAVPLPNNGKVLITSGFSQGESTATSELYDPDTQLFTPAGSLTLARMSIAAAADPVSGAVLAVGGFSTDGPVAACGILRSPSVVFDKTRYLDSDAVTVSGLGWKAGETVKLALKTSAFTKPGQIGLVSVQNFQTTASPLGRIQLTLFVASALNAGATYSVTATGMASGLTASNSAVQISRTNVTLNVFPFPALTRQPVTLQAVVQPVTALDALDGAVNFQLGTTPLGSVATTSQTITVLQTGQILDGTSNTIQFGELPLNATGFGTKFTAPDGSVRFLNAGGVFQFVTKDIPAGSSGITLNGSTPGSATASYAPITSLYATTSSTTTVSVQKRTVNINIQPGAATPSPKVGQLFLLNVTVTPTQVPFADVAPSGTAHLTVAPGTVVDVPLGPGFNPGAGGLASLRLPAGPHAFSAQYDGDSVYLPGSVTGAGSVNIGKGTLGFSLIPGKSSYTVGEQITLVGRIQHPQVPGATPTGQISRTAGPAQFQGATIGADPQNTGTIDTPLPVAGFPSPGNFVITMSYGGDANFVPATAGAILTVTKAVPQITVVPPAQIAAGQPASFVVRVTPHVGLSAPPATGTVTISGVPNGTSGGLVSGASSSTAILRQTFPTAGTFSITVQYGGDSNYLGAATAPLQVAVQ